MGLGFGFGFGSGFGFGFGFGSGFGLGGVRVSLGLANQVVQAGGDVVHDRAAHGGVPGAARLLGDGEAVREGVERLLVLLAVEERLRLREQLLGCGVGSR